MIRHLIILSLLLGGLPLYGQVDNSSAGDPSMSRKSMLILPSNEVEDDPFGIEIEVARSIASIAVDLGRYEIIDRNNLGAILAEQDLVLYGIVDDSAAVSIGKIASANEALMISVSRFTQRGVPKEGDNNDNDDDEEDVSDAVPIFKAIIANFLPELADLPELQTDRDEVDDPYPNNIETTLSVEVRNIDVETSESLYSFRIDAHHTGGSLGKSRAKTMAIFRRKVEAELKGLYLLETKIISRDPSEIMVLLGTDLGVKRGMIFEILEPTTEDSSSGRSITLPGRSVAYAKIAEAGDEASRGILIRGWLPVRSGYVARERVKSLSAGLLELSVTPSGPLTVGLSGMARGYGFWDVGVGIRYVNLTDSRNEATNGVTLDISAGTRLIDTQKLSLLVSLGMMGAGQFRSDDMEQAVVAGLGTPFVGAQLEILRNRDTDFVLGLGYRFSGKTSSWFMLQSEEDEDVTPAIWTASAPEIDVSGFYLTLAMKFMMSPSLPDF